MLNVTYYLGAGASAQALPTVKTTKTSQGLSSCFHEIALSLKGDTSVKDEYFASRDALIANLEWLAENSEKFGTVDTFAKFLHLQNDCKLQALKETLSIVFAILQTINRKIDICPLIFLTTILQEKFSFPRHIKIISWNYDFQIQLAGQEFRQEGFNYDYNSSIQSDPLINYYPSLGHLSTAKTDEVCMVNLNGIAGFYIEDKTGYNFNVSHFHNNPPKDINDFLKKADVNRKNLLTFAWEKGEFSEKSREIAKRIIKETDILVIIGYSFPVFNREIDNDIFSVIKEQGRLKKIFFQDPYRSGDFLRNQFELDSKIQILDVQDGGNYHVPMDL